MRTSMAAKFNDDVNYTIEYYAKVGGMKRREVQHLERQFLNLLGWKLHETPEE